MSSLELARWQFAITTLYHFLFVPVTIGLSLFVAVCQTRWRRTGDEAWLRATRFWAKLMLVSFALGVVTGIWQEFQFGMNWSDYSRFVGDVFGAPLAMEGLAAFFVESTFLGLWLFGWGRLPPRVHLATIWAVALSTMLSAYFILAANSWMQHPVGTELDRATGRAHLTSIFDLLTNSTTLYAFSHTIFAAIVTAGMVVLAVSAYHLRRGSEAVVFGHSTRIAVPAVCVAVLATMTIGHFMGDLLEEQQPMKMAAADAVFETKKGAGLSIFATGDFESNPQGLNRNIEIPHLLSLLATLSWNGEVKGINQIQREEQALYGPGNYVPIVAVNYWTWRAMIGAGTLMFLLTLWGLWLRRKGRFETSARFHRLAIWAVVLPFFANSAGWLFAEMGRQPWVVFGLLRTSDGDSPTVGSAEVILSLGGLVLVYTFLAVVAGRVFLREARHGPPPAPRPGEEPADHDLALAY